jgi:regulator of cell morphogenesis and NO signaling
MIDGTMMVSAIVRKHPALAEVFEGVGIDYCCGGNRPLSDACAEKELDLATVVKLLNASTGARLGGEERVDDYPTEKLIDHIVDTHHSYLRSALPRLDTMVAKVAEGHKKDDPRLEEVKQVYDRLRAELLPHQDREEQELFPAIRESVRNPEAAVSDSLIKELREDHSAVGEMLAELNRLTDNYTPQEWACPTTHAMLHALSELERDTHQHVHKENNILFPRAEGHRAT